MLDAPLRLSLNSLRQTGSFTRWYEAVLTGINNIIIIYVRKVLDQGCRREVVRTLREVLRKVAGHVAEGCERLREVRGIYMVFNGRVPP